MNITVCANVEKPFKTNQRIGSQMGRQTKPILIKTVKCN